jgi:hypothetical protein
MPQSLLTGQLKEKPTKRVWCLYSSFIHDSSYRRDFGIYRKEDVQFQLKIRGASVALVKANIGQFSSTCRNETVPVENI